MKSIFNAERKNMGKIDFTGAVIHRYRCIADDQNIDFTGDITAIIGENEAGKTSILQAIAKAGCYGTETRNLKFNPEDDYPKRKIKELEGDAPKAVTMKYVMSSGFADEIEKATGEKIRDRSFLAVTDYENRMRIDGPFSEMIQEKYIKPNLPVFLYYDEYYSLPSRVSLDRLCRGENLTLSERTAQALLYLADFDTEKTDDTGDDSFYKTKLENIQAEFTENFLKYWTGNSDLQIEFEITKEEKATKEPSKGLFARFRKTHSTEKERFLEIRINDRKNMVSMPLDKRSRGFNWFFSFWVWFKAVQKEDAANYVFLLDEPGMWLHEEGQKDLMKLMDEISGQSKIIFTTHSLFMAKWANGNLYEICDGRFVKTALENE